MAKLLTSFFTYKAFSLCGHGPKFLQMFSEVKGLYSQSQSLSLSFSLSLFLFLSHCVASPLVVHEVKMEAAWGLVS